jgi:hypothetical protein
MNLINAFIMLQKNKVIVYLIYYLWLIRIKEYKFRLSIGQIQFYLKVDQKKFTEILYIH